MEDLSGVEDLMSTLPESLPRLVALETQTLDLHSFELCEAAAPYVATQEHQHHAKKLIQRLANEAEPREVVLALLATMRANDEPFASCINAFFIDMLGEVLTRVQRRRRQVITECLASLAARFLDGPDDTWTNFSRPIKSLISCASSILISHGASSETPTLVGGERLTTLHFLLRCLEMAAQDAEVDAEQAAFSALLHANIRLIECISDDECSAMRRAAIYASRLVCAKEESHLPSGTVEMFLGSGNSSGSPIELIRFVAENLLGPSRLRPRGTALLSWVVSKVEPGLLNGDDFTEEVHAAAAACANRLVSHMSEFPQQEERSFAYKLLIRFLNLWDDHGRWKLLNSLMSKCSHPPAVALLLHMAKAEYVEARARQSTTPSANEM